LTVEILKEHSQRQRDKITAYVGNDPERFADLVAVFLKGPYRVTQRAAWPLSHCIEKYPTLLRPHWKRILTFTERPGVHDAVKRNVLRMFQFVQVPKVYQGRTADLCLRLLTNTQEAVAIQVFAMSVLANLAKEVPELKNELIPVIEDQLPFASAGFQSRGRKVLKQLKQ
jgi:hypothetical protein